MNGEALQSKGEELMRWHKEGGMKAGTMVWSWRK